jgi:hypothetical protein
VKKRQSHELLDADDREGKLMDSRVVILPWIGNDSRRGRDGSLSSEEGRY